MNVYLNSTKKNNHLFELKRSTTNFYSVATAAPFLSKIAEFILIKKINVLGNQI